ncbi:MAG TPA: SRPBCC domain-containing protein [Gemmatimonadales bacterium]|nr:SRPBCC domain-containing protein [Gemmatimonadales bacterium]
MTMDPADDALVVRRVLAVPREQVFAAWLDPASLAQWMRPGTVAAATVEVDPRVGGKFRIVMVHGERSDEHRGEYLAIEPPSLLSFTWVSVHTDQRPTVVTIEFRERGKGTELILTHRRLPATKVDAHRKGWTDIVRKLEATLTARPHPT